MVIVYYISYTIWVWFDNILFRVLTSIFILLSFLIISLASKLCWPCKVSVKEFVLTWVDLFFESLIDLFFLIDLSLKTLGLKKEKTKTLCLGFTEWNDFNH